MINIFGGSSIIALSFPWLFVLVVLILLAWLVIGWILGYNYAFLRMRNSKELKQHEKSDDELIKENEDLRTRIESHKAVEERARVLEKTLPELKQRLEKYSVLDTQVAQLRKRASDADRLESELKSLRSKLSSNSSSEQNSNISKAAALPKPDHKSKDKDPGLTKQDHDSQAEDIEKSHDSDVSEETKSGTEEKTSNQNNSDDSWRSGVTKLGTPGANHTDDLKAIKGIGPVMEKVLFSFDITTWEQIAAFTPQDIEKVSEAIDAFPGRIERDDWVGGAQKLLDEGHPES